MAKSSPYLACMSIPKICAKSGTSYKVSNENSYVLPIGGDTFHVLLLAWINMANMAFAIVTSKGDAHVMISISDDKFVPQSGASVSTERLMEISQLSRNLLLKTESPTLARCYGRRDRNSNLYYRGRICCFPSKLKLAYQL